ncbi:MAG: ABC transporter ATP-binding protein [Okeania sp. SIO2G4]|uniref:ABC transporter ATP-binding protein n=1 Tax=unclassified Okeania TaxID=2634635 RepID=UPI0013B8E820|nr:MULTISPECIES: ABC transporter ATP-binding protein [unclassified Okeania]NEP04426.1 ABC transporter ATP-binding protein [Okeania sp. SIO4D6]NEP41431.1 ABC transporter ATP-binding protein [Okeania sp. SIO2H7]NEP70786.1 ABC transporter ATP-binding protein [Okeania sp. SIO2G5]NEP93566.1 ABC transporter ATP-binding protein [Okeania sp. SIO2F5]NEQ93658.1 ABC transporter ATP-binding protein [Okeania sp. SIO2G4]
MKPRSNYWKLLPYIYEHWPTILKALGCTLAFTIFWPILAWLLGEMAGHIGRGDVGAIAQLAGLAAIIFLIKGTVQYGQDTFMAKAAFTIALDLRKEVYSHLQRLNISYFEKSKTGDLSYRLTEDIDRTGEVVNKFFHQFVPCILQLIVVLGYMIYLNWQLTVVTLVVAPLMALLIGWFGELLLSFSHQSQNRTSNLSALITEVFNGIRIVQAFAAEEYQIAIFSVEAEQNRQAKYMAEKVKALQFVVVGFLEAMSVAFLFFLGAWQISEGNLSGEGFISYLTGVALLIDPISLTTSNYSEFKQGEASCDRIFELLNIQPQVTEKLDAIALPPVLGKVEYKNVCFDYQSEKKVLKNLNLLVNSGEIIALVGASGAGKTTLANLLPRFYDVQSGEILIDDINIKDVTLTSLRRQIGIVPQEVILFSGTISQNIAFGQLNYNIDAVKKAAKVANAHQFITKLSKGYQTWVGERGINLSGGQRQRIAIARAILENPKILILDEATSSLDSESEFLVQEALERLMQGRTVFIIAHRLATVRRANRILVMENGEILESGTHSELLEKGMLYARFYQQQFS